MCSVGLIVLGAFVAGARDLSFDAYGYAVVFLANITTAIYLATIARLGIHHYIPPPPKKKIQPGTRDSLLHHC